MVLRRRRGVEEKGDCLVTEFLGESNALGRLRYRETNERGQAIGATLTA